MRPCLIQGNSQCFEGFNDCRFPSRLEKAASAEGSEGGVGPVHDSAPNLTQSSRNREEENDRP